MARHVIHLYELVCRKICSNYLLSSAFRQEAEVNRQVEESIFLFFLRRKINLTSKQEDKNDDPKYKQRRGKYERYYRDYLFLCFLHHCND